MEITVSSETQTIGKERMVTFYQKGCNVHVLTIFQGKRKSKIVYNYTCPKIFALNCSNEKVCNFPPKTVVELIFIVYKSSCFPQFSNKFLKHKIQREKKKVNLLHMLARIIPSKIFPTLKYQISIIIC